MTTNTVRHLIETGKSFVVVYRDAEDNITERIVDVEFINGTLFAGRCHLRDARRCFIFERVLFAAPWDGRPLVTFGADARRERENAMAAAWLPVLSSPAVVCWQVA